MARTNQLSKGPGFLAGTSLSHLNRLYRKERDAKAKLRLLACIKRKEGYTIPQMSSLLKVAPSTISDWLLRIQSEGLYLAARGIAARIKKRANRKRRPGRPRIFDHETYTRVRSNVERFSAG
jgi:transposase